MPLFSRETLEWLDRADPGAKRAVLALADSFDRLARAAANPEVARRRELAKQTEP